MMLLSSDLEGFVESREPLGRGDFLFESESIVKKTMNKPNPNQAH